MSLAHIPVIPRPPATCSPPATAPHRQWPSAELLSPELLSSAELLWVRSRQQPLIFRPHVLISSHVTRPPCCSDTGNHSLVGIILASVVPFYFFSLFSVSFLFANKYWFLQDSVLGHLSILLLERSVQPRSPGLPGSRPVSRFVHLAHAFLLTCRPALC